MVLGGRIHEHIVEENIDVTVPQVMKDSSGVVKLTPQERVQNSTAEQIINVPQATEEMVEVTQIGATRAKLETHRETDDRAEGRTVM